ncbi:hypothetical protein CJ030_MR6G006015 [Morella rubra]|uniref:Uncharacterized protein n=1 Tax=Morella rubra TaxID=262757 RepID=A0A6A1V7R3_9ROSI|nr:hypothetical protein CJ030_MR6G006015 [Morella rubra]
MARDFFAQVVAHADDAGILLESSGGLLLLGMIVMSLSIISLVIFACGNDGDSDSSKPRKSNGTYLGATCGYAGGGVCGDGGGDCGGGGCGGGGGGCGGGC